MAVGAAGGGTCNPHPQECGTPAAAADEAAGAAAVQVGAEAPVALAAKPSGKAQLLAASYAAAAADARADAP